MLYEYFQNVKIKTPLSQQIISEYAEKQHLDNYIPERHLSCLTIQPICTDIGTAGTEFQCIYEFDKLK